MTSWDANTAGVILAGGRASRMGGRDKAFAAVEGQPIAVRTVRLFQEVFPQVIVATIVESSRPRRPEVDWIENREAFTQEATELREYFAGERREFSLRLAPQGTPFQQRVWKALCRIPYGETWSYGQLASQIGKPSASRAVGLANGRNPLPIVIPCHRVIGANGSLTGYGGGLPIKRHLLALERGDVGLFVRGAGPEGPAYRFRQPTSGAHSR